MKNFKLQTGFTLIETLIYIALLSFFLTSLIGITYQSLESTQKIADKISLQQEANFLIRKIDWALTGASNVSLVSSNQIHIDRYHNAGELASVDIKYNTTAKTIEVFPSDQAQFYALNSSNALVENAIFTLGSQGTSNYVDASLVLKGETFSLKKYLR